MEVKHLSLFTVEKNFSLVEAMKKIDVNSKGILFVINKEGCLCGSVTDGDIRRWLINTGNLDAVVSSLMNKNTLYLAQEDAASYDVYFKNNHISAVPILDKNMRIIDIKFKNSENKQFTRDRKKLENVSIVIMAGGKGTRLYPYTKILPKPLIPIGDVPILERIINAFCDFGINYFYLTVNYRKNMIRSYFSEMDRDYEIEYVEEDKPLGTAGSIRLIREQFDSPLFVTNCDILIHADYADIFNYHKLSQNAITIVAAMKNDIIPYGVIYSKENGIVEKMEEKPSRNYFINTGMYIINPDIINLIPKNVVFHMTDLTDKAIQEGFKVGIYPVSEDSFLDMGQFEEMKKMEEKINLNEN